MIGGVLGSVLVFSFLFLNVRSGLCPEKEGPRVSQQNHKNTFGSQSDATTASDDIALSQQFCDIAIVNLLLSNVTFTKNRQPSLNRP